MFLGVLALLNLRLEDFLELVDFVESVRVPLLVTHSLLQRLLLYLLLDCNVVIFQAFQCRLQLDRTCLSCL